MSKKPDPEMIDDENPEWGDREFKTAKKIGDMPAEFQAAVRRARGPQKAPTKQLVSMRLDGDVIGALKFGGDGWQTRVNRALRSNSRVIAIYLDKKRYTFRRYDLPMNGTQPERYTYAGLLNAPVGGALAPHGELLAEKQNPDLFFFYKEDDESSRYSRLSARDAVAKFGFLSQEQTQELLDALSINDVA